MPASLSPSYIVHRDNPADNLSRQEIERIYINNVPNWPDGMPLTIKGSALIVRRVSRQKGAIGHVSSGLVQDNKDVKVG